MYQPLAPCPACSRHVKTAERICPFCEGALTEAIGESALPVASSRLSRAAAIAFTASLAVTGVASASVGCSTGTVPGPTSDASPGPNDDGGNQAAYGAPAFDAGPDDSGGGGTKYGGPPIDASGD